MSTVTGTPRFVRTQLAFATIAVFFCLVTLCPAFTHANGSLNVENFDIPAYVVEPGDPHPHDPSAESTAAGSDVGGTPSSTAPPIPSIDPSTFSDSHETEQVQSDSSATASNGLTTVDSPSLPEDESQLLDSSRVPPKLESDVDLPSRSIDSETIEVSFLEAESGVPDSGSEYSSLHTDSVAPAPASDSVQAESPPAEFQAPRPHRGLGRNMFIRSVEELLNGVKGAMKHYSTSNSSSDIKEENADSAADPDLAPLNRTASQGVVLSIMLVYADECAVTPLVGREFSKLRHFFPSVDLFFFDISSENDVPFIIIFGVPTIILYKGDAVMGTEYHGPWEVSAMVSFISEQSGMAPQNVSAPDAVPTEFTDINSPVLRSWRARHVSSLPPAADAANHSVPSPSYPRPYLLQPGFPLWRSILSAPSNTHYGGTIDPGFVLCFAVTAAYAVYMSFPFVRCVWMMGLWVLRLRNRPLRAEHEL